MTWWFDFNNKRIFALYIWGLPWVKQQVSGNDPDNKVYGANMEPTWGQQDPGGPHVCPMNFAIWEALLKFSGQITKGL